MPEDIRVGSKTIGEGRPVFFAAEAGLNFDDSSGAKKLVDAAARAGCDAIKFQTFRADKLATKGAEFTAIRGKKTMSQYGVFKKHELSRAQHLELMKYANSKGLVFFSTPSDEESVDLLDAIGVPVFKTGSDDLTNYPFLKYVASKGKPVVVSTGMSAMDEVKKAVSSIRGEGNDQIIVLHCTTDYPAQLQHLNLRAIRTMREELEVLVGYSDHTLGFIAPALAAALGAVFVEKHVALSRSAPGVDNHAATEPKELEELVRILRDSETALGSSEKKITEAERKWRLEARKSLVASRGLKAGARLSGADVAIKRPGTGMQPEMLDRIVGKSLARKVAKDALFEPADFK